MAKAKSEPYKSIDALCEEIRLLATEQFKTGQEGGNWHNVQIDMVNKFGELKIFLERICQQRTKNPWLVCNIYEGNTCKGEKPVLERKPRNGVSTPQLYFQSLKLYYIKGDLTHEKVYYH